MPFGLHVYACTYWGFYCFNVSWLIDLLMETNMLIVYRGGHLPDWFENAHPLTFDLTTPQGVPSQADTDYIGLEVGETQIKRLP